MPGTWTPGDIDIITIAVGLPALDRYLVAEGYAQDRAQVLETYTTSPRIKFTYRSYSKTPTPLMSA